MYRALSHGKGRAVAVPDRDSKAGTQGAARQPRIPRTLGENHATRPNSQCFEVIWGEFKQRKKGNAFLCAKGSVGLFWELSPGPLAPEARIMPPDQTAINKAGAASLVGNNH